MSEHPMTPDRKREKLCELLFETFNVPQYLPALSPILAAYASGRTTAVVVDIGTLQTFKI